jgi:hypothetical protein
MISDSLANNMAADTGSLHISVESWIFGENSTVYDRTSEILEAKTVNHSDHFVKSGVAAGLCIYFLIMLFVLKGRTSSIGKMLTDYRFTKKQYEATTRISTINTTYIVLFTIIIASVQFTLMANYQEYRMTAVSFLALSGIFLLQSAALKTVALICKSENILGEVNLNRKLYFGMLGIAVLPFTVLALLYAGTDVEETALAISKILAGILMLFMVIRILRVFSEARVSYFFRFLYLCTFEISPYLALFIVFENIK